MATTTTNNGWTIPQSTDLVSQGATAIAALGNGIDTSVGTGLLAWTAWTPTYTNFTVSSGTHYYCQIGKTVIIRGTVTLNAAPTGNLTISTPASRSFRNSAWAVGQPIGTAFLIDSSPLTTWFGFPTYASTTTITFGVINASGTYSISNTVNATVPVTWASGDSIYYTAQYEMA